MRQKSGWKYSFLVSLIFLVILSTGSLWAAVPNPPSGLTATALSSTQIRLDWTDNSTDETYFYIERKTGTGGTYAYIGNVGTNITTYTSTNLTQNTEYYYRVRAYNASGYSTYSNETSATTLTLNAPSNLSVSSVSYTQVTLTWTDNSSDEGGFYIERKTGAAGTYSQIGSASANATTYTSTGLTQGTEYYFRVRSYSGSNYSTYLKEVDATTLTLNAPSGLTATPLSATQITLDWTDNSTDETNFYIERKTGAGGIYAYIGNVGVNITTYTSTGLTQNTTYYYRVRAYNAGNYSAYSNEASATTPTLNAPSNLSVSAVSYTQITLTWTDNSSDESGFSIERKTGAGGTYAAITTTAANATTYTNTGLTQGTEYYYRVRAVSGSNYSQYSNEVNATTPTLPPPSGLKATPLSSTQIKLTWTDNSSDENYFYIEYKTTGNYTTLTSVTANTTTYTHTNLTQNTTYTYRVRAYNSSNNAYSAYSNEASATTLTLNAPSNLSVSAVSYTQITLTWTDNSSDESGFSIERKTGAGGTYSQVGSVGVNVTTYTSTGLSQGTEYYFRVRSYSGSNYSTYSNEVNATTMTLNAPSSLTATALSSTQIRLDWTDNSTDETNFYIERKTGATGTYSYIGSVGANVTTYTSTNLAQETTYFYRVRAYNAGNYSTYSNEAGAATLSLNSPSNLSVTAISSTQVKLTWTDNSSDESGFKIERKAGTGGTYTTIYTTSANVTIYTNTGLTQGTEYYYRVRAYSGSNYSEYSNEVSVTPTLLAPSNLTAAPLSSWYIELTWNDNSTDETYFYIEYKVGTSDTYTTLASVSANTTTYSHANLTPDTTYHYRIRAYNSGGYSAYSNEASATTPSQPPTGPPSIRIALVPNAQGRYNFGGTIPTSNFTDGFAPAFVNTSPESIRDNPTNPLVEGGVDTVVLVGICDINTFLSNNQFKSRIENFVASGGKLIVWDSECQNTNYSMFVFPFTTSNPGQMGATGTLTDVEENTLSSKGSSSPFYVNTYLIGSQTDAVGDANVMVTKDPNWCIDMTAKNYYGVTGPVHTYSQYGQGLIIYNGLDKDYLYNGQIIGTADGRQNLGKIWELELKQAWNPVPFDTQTGKSVLPCLVPVIGLQLSPENATNPINTFHTLTAKATDQLGNPLSGETVIFTVTSGPHTGTSGSAVTGSDGLAAYSYKGVSPGTDIIEATATINGSTVKSKAVTKQWFLALTDVRVIDTISKVSITIDQLSISSSPFSITQIDDTVVIEWQYSSISIGQVEDLSFNINLLNPVPGEDRLVNHKLELLYNDVNGNPVRTELGPQYVHVLNSAFDSTISTDKPIYQASEDVLIYASVTNLSEYAKTIDAKILIEDSQRVLVKEVTILSNLSFTAGETKNFGNLIFNTDSYYAGDYRAHLILYENQKQVGEALTNFKIQPTIAVNSKVTTDKTAYMANEPVTITSTILSACPNYILSNLNARITISNSQGQNLFTDEKPIQTLMPGQLIELKTYWNTSTYPKGIYTVTLEVIEAVVLSTSMTTFEILGTSETGKGLTGTITAQPDPVYQGKDETITYSVTNKGNEDVSNLNVKIIIVDPDTQGIKQTFETSANISMNTTIAGNFVLSTSNLLPETYLAILQVSSATKTQTKTLASTTFEVIRVKPYIEITKTIPDIKNVLVWLNYPWQSGQNCPERSLIERALDEAGVTYYIVLDKNSFETELRNPYYTDIMILGTHNPVEDHIAEELRELVYSGKGLISSMFYRQNLNEGVFGIRFINYLSGSDYPIELLESEIATEGDFQSYGRVLNVDVLNSEENIGWIVETTKKGTNRYPGIIKHDFGLGKVLFYAFDLGLSSTSYSQFAALLENSVNYIHKPTSNPEGLPYSSSQLIPVEIKIKSLGGAFDLRITETYPSEIKIYDPSTGQWITENPWITNIHLEPNETKTIIYYALTPDGAGIYTLQTGVGYMENGTYNLYQSLSVDVTMNKDTATAIGDILSALKVLQVSWQEKAKVDEAIKYIEDIRVRAITSEQDIEKNIHDILKAVDSLLSITSIDTSNIRFMMDELLKVWEGRWYYK